MLTQNRYNYASSSVALALMATADQFYDNHGIIGDSEVLVMSDFGTVKQIVGFDQLEEFERDYPCA
jgi:hypothetical protein